MIHYKILKTNITITIWRTVRRITNEILGVKGMGNLQTKKKGSYFIFCFNEAVKKMLIALDNFFFKPVGCQLATFLRS